MISKYDLLASDVQFSIKIPRELLNDFDKLVPKNARSRYIKSFMIDFIEKEKSKK